MSNQSEKKFAKSIGAKAIKNSGRGIEKSDMKKGKYIIDLKEVKKSFQLNERVWQKVVADAITHGWDKVPVLMIKFEQGTVLTIMQYSDTEISDDG